MAVLNKYSGHDLKKQVEEMHATISRTRATATRRTKTATTEEIDFIQPLVVILCLSLLVYDHRVSLQYRVYFMILKMYWFSEYTQLLPKPNPQNWSRH